MCQLSWNLGASTTWNPQGLSKPVMRLLTLYSLHNNPEEHSSHLLHDRSLKSRMFSSVYSLSRVVFSFCTSSSAQRPAQLCVWKFQTDVGISSLYNCYQIWPANQRTWSTVCIEILTFFQLLRKFLALCGTQLFITMFTSCCHWTLYWTRWILFMPCHCTGSTKKMCTHFNERKLYVIC
jgi:hypothetical protein